MDVKQIITFQKVATYKSFSKAAKVLFLSQPSVTLHILELEKELNVKLFHRTTKSVELTTPGQIFFNFANHMVKLQNDAIKEIEGYKKGSLGTLKVAATGSTYSWLIPELAKFKKYYSKVDLVFDVAITHQVIDMVLDRSVHFGIIRHSVLNFNHTLLVSKGIKKDEGMLIVSPKHKFAKLEEVTLEDIAKEELIVYTTKGEFWIQILSLFRENGLNPKVAMDINDFNVVKLMIQLDLGISFLPLDCVRDEVKQGQLKTVTIKDHPNFQRNSIVIYRKDLILTELHNSFLRMITPVEWKL